MDVIRRAADPACSKRIETTIRAVDHVLLHQPHFRAPLKALFGLAHLEHDEDFASVLSVSPYVFLFLHVRDPNLAQSPLSSWQSKVWDPAVGSNEFDNFCSALSPLGAKEDVLSEIFVLPGRLELPIVVYNYAQYIKKVRPLILGVQCINVITLSRISCLNAQTAPSKRLVPVFSLPYYANSVLISVLWNLQRHPVPEHVSE
jgi:hypothetical protein